MGNNENREVPISNNEEYILKYTGEETDVLLKHTESLKDQTTAEDGEAVQVYDKSGIPHKVAKTELLNKAILATTSIQDISKFIAINEAGDAVGIMTLEQITEVFRKEFAKFPSSSETSAVVAVNKEGDALGLMSNEKLAQVVGELIGKATSEKDGLFPKELTPYNIGKVSPLNFNDLINLFRPYASYGGTNAPIGGAYYWGIYNIGWNSDHFVQIACATLDTSFIGVYARAKNGYSGFTPWRTVQLN